MDRFDRFLDTVLGKSHLIPRGPPPSSSTTSSSSPSTTPVKRSRTYIDTSTLVGNNLQTGVASCQGRRDEQQDAHAMVIGLPLYPHVSYFAVFDGHGPSDLAASYCSKHLLENIAQTPQFATSFGVGGSGVASSPELLAQSLREGFIKTDTDLRELLESNKNSGEAETARRSRLAVLQREGEEGGGGGGRGGGGSSSTMTSHRFSSSPTPLALTLHKTPGTTAVVAFITPDTIIVGNAGDSRALLIRANGECRALSRDHQPGVPHEMQRIVACGSRVLQRTGGLPRIEGKLSVSRGIGDYQHKSHGGRQITEQPVSPEPEVIICPRDHQHDMFLILACDGIWGLLRNEQVSHFLLKELFDNRGKGIPLRDIASRLVKLCYDGGSTDNLTALIVGLPAALEILGPLSAVVGSSSSVVGVGGEGGAGAGGGGGTTATTSSSSGSSSSREGEGEGGKAGRVVVVGGGGGIESSTLSSSSAPPAFLSPPARSSSSLLSTATTTTTTTTTTADKPTSK